MSRRLSIQYPDEWYHVMNRGRRVFFEQEAYQVFIDLSKEAVDLWRVRIAAYCMMSNTITC